MSNIKPHKEFKAHETQKEKDKDKEVTDDLGAGSEPPDVVEASEEDVQEAPYGNRSYAAPDFNDDKD